MTKLRLPPLRCAFLSVFEPSAVGDSEPAYSLRLIVPPTHAVVKQVDAAMLTAAKDRWKEKAPAILKKLIAEGEVCLLKEDYVNKDGDVYDGFAGMFSIRARSYTAPLIIDRDKTPLSKKDGRPYSGCTIVAEVDVYAQDNAAGRGIRARLMGVQFVKDGEAFGAGAPASADDFEDLSDMGEDDEEENEFA